MYDLFLQRLHGRLFIGSAAECTECKRNTVTIHEQSHLYDRIRSVLFGFPVFSEIIGLFDLEEEVCAVIVENSVVARNNKITVPVDIGLDIVIFFGDNRKSTVNLMDIIFWRLKQ